jgi:primosomal protein N' (replication factor Y)
MILEVAINIPIFNTYYYLYNNNDSYTLPLRGRRVSVPFRNKKSWGIIINTFDSIEQIPSLVSTKKKISLKEIQSIIDETPIFDEGLMKLLLWASNYYHYPVGQTLFSALPKAIKNDEKIKEEQIKIWFLKDKDYSTKISHRSKNALKVISVLEKQDLTDDKIKELDVPISTINNLKKLDIIDFYLKNAEYKIWHQKYDNILKTPPLQLNTEQQNALKQITSVNDFNCFFINGVTGSGKTEVYLQVIEHYLKQKKQVLVLIPEINLTKQTIDRFRNRFNVEIVKNNSSLSEREKLISFNKIRNEEAAILIGTRSSLFFNIKNLGLIIIDEEHDESYKQNDSLLYSARDTAIMLAKFKDIPIVLGSATPSIETYLNAKTGKYKELKLRNRAGNSKKIIFSLSDMKKENLIYGLTATMIKEIERTISEGNQALIMLNKRGYANQYVCHHCGHIFTCNHCSKNLIFHKQENYLQCHHCEKKYPIPYECPKCSSNNLKCIGIGTEQLKENLLNLFPNANIAQIDRDTTKTKTALNDYLEKITNNEYQILIGTQMLAKGHHFPNVTFVGILDVDFALYSNDFKATEKLAQLITQVSGRAGRENKQGYVCIQTLQPEHKIFSMIKNDNYDFLCDDILSQRKLAHLPPYSYIAIIKACAKHKNAVITNLSHVLNILKLACKNITNDVVTISPPYPSSVERRKDKYNYQILIQSNSRKNLAYLLNVFTEQIGTLPIKSNVQYAIDVDPSFIM